MKINRVVRMWLGHTILIAVATVLAITAIIAPMGVQLFVEADLDGAGPILVMVNELSDEQFYEVFERDRRAGLSFLNLSSTRSLYNLVYKYHWPSHKHAMGEFFNGIREGHVPYPVTRNTTGNFLELARGGLSNSLKLFFYAFAMAMAGGTILGILYASRQRLWRGINMSVSIIGLALPEFVVIVVMHMATIFAVANFGKPLWPILADPGTDRGWVVPLAAMTVAPLAYTARQVAVVFDEILDEAYIRTARGKGLPEWRVLLQHAGRNAWPRVLAGLPVILGICMSSLIIVERATLWPGLLKYVLNIGSGGPGSTPYMRATATLYLIAWYGIMDAGVRTVAGAAGSSTGRREAGA